MASSIPAVTLAFYRWAVASLLLIPIAGRRFWKERKLLLQHLPYLFLVAVTGISLFNTLLYIAAHSTSAINLALIGTTSSPVFSIILAAIFLGERIGALRIVGLSLCLLGILDLLTRGVPSRILHLQFSSGDAWVLLAALAFAIYNTLVKKKPVDISPISFLFTTFLLGCMMLFPFFLYESLHTKPIIWNSNLYAIILYLGAGTSVLAFFCWNVAISKLGAARTALFGNLIPVFSIIEAVIFLGEDFTWIHLVSGSLIVAGLILANIKNTSSKTEEKKLMHAG